MSEIVTQDVSSKMRNQTGRPGMDLGSVSTQLAESTSNANSKEINVLFPPAPLVAAKGDGTTDDTAAIQAIIDSLTIGTVVFPPNRTYLLGDITLKSGITITSRGSRTASYSGTSGMACLKAKSGASYILKGSISGYAIEGIFFNGNAKATHGVSGNMSSGTIKNNVFYQCNAGFGNNNSGYARSTVLENNTFRECNTAIRDIMDSRIINNFIYSNGRGIYLSAGSNDNIIVNNKIEWNNGYGIEGFQANGCSIAGNIIDRSDKSGVKLNSCVDFSITNNIFRRNGANSTDTDQSHAKFESCTNYTFVGNTLRDGNTQDDGSGVSAPYYGIYSQNNTGGLISGNDLTGYVNTEFFTTGDTGVNKLSNNTDAVIINKVLQAERYYARKSNTTINAGVTSSITLTGGKTATSTFSRTFKKLKVVGRNTSSAVSYYGEKLLIVKRESGGAIIELAPAVNYFGALLDSGLTFANFTTDTTGSYVTFDATNTSGNNLQLTFELTD